MRLVVAQCQVDYVGRLSAHLPMARRLLLVKADGSVSVHADDRAYKPLNWMSPPCVLQETHDEGNTVWEVTNKAGERLIIRLGEIEHARGNPSLHRDALDDLRGRRRGLGARRPSFVSTPGAVAARSARRQVPRDACEPGPPSAVRDRASQRREQRVLAEVVRTAR